MKEKSNKTKTFSFDIGTASIGWSVIEQPLEESSINFDEETGEIFSKINIISSGVRMFNEPVVATAGKLLNVTRRTNRLSRRRTRRVALRKNNIKKMLLSLGYYNEDDFNHFLENGDINYNSVFQRIIKNNQKEPEKHNIFYLRVKALDHQLTKDELAVVLFNLAKTRGFKSSKKVRPNEDKLKQDNQEESKDKESGKVLEAIKKLKSKQEEVKESYGKSTRTFAELIYFLNSKAELNSYRNKESDYSNSILRSDIINEAKLIFAKQREFYKELTSDFEDKFLEEIIHQREVIFDTSSIGKCTYIKDEFRASKSCFSSEYYTSLSRLINLRVILNNKNSSNDFLDKMEDSFALNKKIIQEILNEVVNNYGKLTYKQLRKKLNLNEKDYFKGLPYSNESSFNNDYSKDDVESNSKKLIINFEETKKVQKYLSSLVENNELSKKNYEFLINKNNSKILDQLVQLNCLYNQSDLEKEIEKTDNLKNLPKQIKDAIICCNLSFTKYLQLSLKAMYLIIPYMEELYPSAIVNGIKTNLEDKNNRWESTQVIGQLIKEGKFKKIEPKKEDQLPSIVEIEKKGDFYIPNHAVIKRAVTQVIKTFNAMVNEYGKPDLVNIELLRELKSPSSKNKATKKREDNTIAKLQAKEECIKLGIVEPNDIDILKVKLLQEQAYSCPYCSGGISLPDLSDQNYTQIDHIIPYSLSFDNSDNNKVVVHTHCNQNKLQKTPYLWLKDEVQEWEKFKNWVYNSSLSKQKTNRLLNQQDINGIRQGFVERQKNDSAYITTLIKDIIEFYFDFPKSSKNRNVYATKGGLTSILRDIFEFKKYRTYEDLKKDKGYFLYNKIIWNEEKNPVVKKKLNSINNEIKSLKKEISESKKRDEKESPETKKKLDELEKKFKNIREAFVSYFADYFNDSIKEGFDDELSTKEKKGSIKLKIPLSIEEYLKDSSLSTYLTELKAENDFDEEFKKMEANFIGDKHHALDAILIALIDASMIQSIGTLSSQSDKIISLKANSLESSKEKNKLLKLIYNGTIKEKIIFLIQNNDYIQNLKKQDEANISSLQFKLASLETLKEQIWESLDKIFISRQPNRKVSGRIHEDTIYSAKETKKVMDSKNQLKLTKRKLVSELSDDDINKIVGTKHLQEAILHWKKDKSENKESYPRMLSKDGFNRPFIKKVTITTKESGEGFYNIRGGLVDSDKKIRVDIFKIKQVNKKGNISYKYALRPISLADIVIKKEVPLKLTGTHGFLDSEQGGEGQEFMFSLYPNDLFYYKKDEKSDPEYAYYLSYKTRENQIEYTDHNKLKKYKSMDGRLFLAIGSLYSLKKAGVDLLGNISIVKNNKYEDFSNLINKKEK